jgi:hypothetical protein
VHERLHPASAFMEPVDIRGWARPVSSAVLPELPPESGRKIAMIGGGACRYFGGLAAAAQRP